MSSKTVRKALVLLSCTFLGLICGTLYLYSSYSPQFARQLGYSVTDSSTIALSGTIGVASAGPLAGIVVDRRGYTWSLMFGGMAIIGGYLGLKSQFDTKLSQLFVSCVLLFLVGAGSTFISATCLKCCAINFPNIRGVATSLPLALYGLSAMFYSVVASIFFPGKTSEFLGFLSMSSVFIFTMCAPSIMTCKNDFGKLRRAVAKTPRPEVIELSSLGSGGNALQLRADTRAAVNYPKIGGEVRDPDVRGVSLVQSKRFWLIFFLTGSLASMGQMYIYSVGFMVKALVGKEFGAIVDPGAVQQVEELVQKNQQLQVGLLSVANCVGRILAGILGDIITQSFHQERNWLLFVPTLGLMTTQLMALTIGEYSRLSLISLLTGLFYGFTFCIMPMIIGDTFGMENFTSNWGVVGLAPILPSYYFTSLFGKIYDSNSSIAEATGLTACHLGKECYSSIFRLTSVITVLSVISALMLIFMKNLDKKTTIDLKRMSS